MSMGVFLKVMTPPKEEPLACPSGGVPEGIVLMKHARTKCVIVPDGLPVV